MDSNGNVHRAANGPLDMAIIITRVRQQRQHPINRRSRRRVRRNHWMAKYRQIRRWNPSRQQHQQRLQPDPDKSKRKRNKSTMSMWQSTWWVSTRPCFAAKRGKKKLFSPFLSLLHTNTPWSKKRMKTFYKQQTFVGPNLSAIWKPFSELPIKSSWITTKECRAKR